MMFRTRKGQFGKYDCRRHEEKWLLSVGSKLREQVEMPYIFVPGVFLCRQSELFLAFRTSHSYSRIVDKKMRPSSSKQADLESL